MKSIEVIINDDEGNRVELYIKAEENTTNVASVTRFLGSVDKKEMDYRTVLMLLLVVDAILKIEKEYIDGKSKEFHFGVEAGTRPGCGEKVV